MTDNFIPEIILPQLKVSSKREALKELAKQIANIVKKDERLVFEVLLERENLGSTAIGKGIAIPHGRLDDLDKIVGVFAKLDEPVDFDSADGNPVDLVFMFLSPSNAGADHLSALAKISGLFRNEELCKKLRAALNADEILSLIGI